MHTGEVWRLFNQNGGPYLKAVSLELTHFEKLEIFVNSHLALQKHQPTSSLCLKDLNNQLKLLGQSDDNVGARAICFCVVAFAYEILSQSSGSTCLLDAPRFYEHYPQYYKGCKGMDAADLLYLCNMLIVALNIFRAGNCKGMLMEVVAHICRSFGGKTVKYKCGGGKDKNDVKREFPLLTFYESEFAKVEHVDSVVSNVPGAPFTEVSAHSVETIPLNITGQKRSGSFEEMPAEVSLRPRHTASVVSASHDMDAIGEELDPNVLSEWLATLAEPPVVLPVNPASAVDFSPDCMSSPVSPPRLDVFTSKFSPASLDATDDESEITVGDISLPPAVADALFASDAFFVSDDEEEALIHDPAPDLVAATLDVTDDESCTSVEDGSHYHDALKITKFLSYYGFRVRDDEVEWSEG
eukprot:gene16125-18409_t